jgi:hypothetical protein
MPCLVVGLPHCIPTRYVHNTVSNDMMITLWWYTLCA